LKLLSMRFVMKTKEELEKQVMIAAREQGMSNVLLRNAVCRKLNLNSTDMECMSLLTIKNISNPTELAHYTGLSPGSTTAMLDRLEKVKLIKRKPNRRDRRGVLIEINHKTYAKVGVMFAGTYQTLSDMIATYSAAELETIADFLTRFTSNVKEHTEQIEKNIT
jgi:DNA-binding MarR family transcriptional regulator